MSESNDENAYRNLAVDRLRPKEIHWALNHDAVHGIAYAFNNPLAVTEATDDPNDDRKTYLVRVKRNDLAKAIAKINEWILEHPTSGTTAYGFLRALSREGLAEHIADDEGRR